MTTRFGTQRPTCVVDVDGYAMAALLISLAVAPIAPGLDQDVQDVAVLVNRSPQIVPLPLDGHEEFVQIPGVAHPTASAPQSPRVVESERLTPLPNRFIRHDDTPFGEEIFDITKTQAETVSRPGELHPQPLVERRS